MDKSDLDKLIRIADPVREFSTLVTNLQIQDSRLTGYPNQYKEYHSLITPIISRYIDYRLEFAAIPRPESVSFGNVVTAFMALKGFLDGIIKQETLGSRVILDQIKEEFFIDDDKPFSAYKAISDITSKAVKSLKIIDNYLESSSLDFFLGINSKVSVQVLTMKLQPNESAFKAAITKFLAQWGGVSFEVKIINRSDDRFIIIDDEQVWHLGPSLNRLGTKPAMISLIRDEEISKHIIEIFDEKWSSA